MNLVSCNLLNPNQSDFRPGDTIVTQLNSITHTIFKAFDCNPSLHVRSVYLDISEAFDRVWHGLIHKLKRCGISGSIIPKCKLQIGNNIIKQVESFKYLGSTITADGKCDVEIRRRIGIAKSTFENLGKILKDHKLSLDIKCRVIND